MHAIPAPTPPTLPVAGSTLRFPVHRIYCVGRNYAAHAREMGHEAPRGQPLFFCKPADAAWPHAQIPYPPGTASLHHEIEWVVALGSGGNAIPADQALECVYGYALGLDLTRRDLQAQAKAQGLPWELAKAFDASAPISPIVPSAQIGHPQQGLLTLSVNGALRQSGDIADMLFRVPEIISELSRWFTLQAGDLIFTGTPPGVGPIERGDGFVARFPGFPDWAACMER